MSTSCREKRIIIVDAVGVDTAFATTFAHGQGAFAAFVATALAHGHDTFTVFAAAAIAFAHGHDICMKLVVASTWIQLRVSSSRLLRLGRRGCPGSDGRWTLGAARGRVCAAEDATTVFAGVDVCKMSV
jgi:hypothetical protein